MCPLNEIKRYCTLENNILSDYQLKNVICFQRERWLSQSYLGSEKPSSPANKALTFPFTLKLYAIISLWKQLKKNKNVAMS